MRAQGDPHPPSAGAANPPDGAQEGPESTQPEESRTAQLGEGAAAWTGCQRFKEETSHDSLARSLQGSTAADKCASALPPLPPSFVPPSQSPCLPRTHSLTHSHKCYL